jgi:hypothetical protein
VLLVKDVVASANYYRDKMGFSYDRFWGESPSFVILQRDGMYVMLRQAADPKHVVPHWTVSDKLWTFGPAGTALLNLVALIWLIQALP